MSWLLCIVEHLLLSLLAIDTLGFIVQNRKNPNSTSQQDYLRVCFTWVFFLALQSLVCSSCGGFLGGIFNFLAFLAKVYITVPMFRGTEKMYTMLIEQNAAKQYLGLLVNIIKERTGSQETQAE